MTVDLSWYEGDRSELRWLFELAEDSESQLDGYLDLGQVLVARADGLLVGHLQVTQTNRAQTLEIKSMAVVEDRQGKGIGRSLIEDAVAYAHAQGADTVLVSTATADVGNLRFYQRVGFRFLSVERDAFTPVTGYPDPIDIDGIPLRDRVWLSRPV